MICRAAISGAIGIAMVLATAAAIAPRALAATDGPYQDVYFVNGCAAGAGLFSPAWLGAMWSSALCPSELDADSYDGAHKGDFAKWSTITPSPSIRIIGVSDTGVADCNLHHDGFVAGYFYGDNGVNYGNPSVTIDCHGATNQNGYAGSLNEHIQSSRYFGWSASCNQASCAPTGAGVVVFSVLKITFEAQETSGPQLAATPGNNLFYRSGWVRGAFPADLLGSDPSGVCSMQTSVNGRAISSYTDPSPDTTQWTQCHGGATNASVDTTAYRNGAGAISLAYSASNAAGAVSSASRAINVDNVTPSVALSAPPDTASAAGLQYVTATASAGPSGIAAIYCSVDGGALQTYPAASAQIPVSGIGSHQVSCYARNHALNVSGVTATSPTTTLDLSIRQPTASAITFARIANALRCRIATEKVKIAGRLRTVRRDGKRIRVRGRARTVRRRVRKCHARTVVRTVRVVLRRHGKPVRRHGRPVYVKRRVRRVLLPHVVDQPVRRVGHGKSTTVNGFLALTDGTALGGQPVDVYASPADNAPRFRLMRVVSTNPDGTWTAKVGAGPSRLIEAVYPGTATTEPATSSTVALHVPARVTLAITPRTLPWRKTMRIRGRLVGGWVPSDGVALRLLVRYPHLKRPTVLLALRTNRRGDFSFTWSYHAGRGAVAYPFAVATTANESDYPFAAARSRWIRVTFGRRTPHPRAHRHKHRRRGRRA